MSFIKARKFVRSLGFSNTEDWKKFINSASFPIDIPKSPYGVYKDEWISWGDFLGTTPGMKRYGRKYLPFKEARDYARSLNLKFAKDWRHK